MRWILLSAFVAAVSTLQHLKDFHRDLRNDEWEKVFGMEKAEGVPPYSLFLPPPLPHSIPTPKQLRFHAMGQEFHFYLKPHKSPLLSPDVISVVRDGERGSRVLHGSLPALSNCHFLADLVSHNNYSAAVSSCDSLRGSVIFPDHFLIFNPLPSRFHSRNTSASGGYEVPHVIFKRSASLSPALSSLHSPRREKQEFVEEVEYKEFCDVKFNYTAPEEARKDSLYIFPNSDPLTLELAVFLDSKLWEYFVEEFGLQRAETEILHFSLALINNVHVLYQQPSISPQLNIVIVRFELWKQQPRGLESRLHKSGQAQLLLDAFCSYQASHNPGTDSSHSAHWDHAVMLTGYDLYHTTSSVAGVAPVARMCDHQFTCALVEGRHLGRSFVLAHEMGHNLGMVHDGVQNLCSSSCCLMSAVNGAGKTTWSACSVREFNAYLLSLGKPGRSPHCLRDSGEGVQDRDHDRDGRLPGQRFTADQQCAFFWGRDYRQEIPTGRSLSSICHILWCGNGGSTISTAHPALDGTWCGGQRWCQSGKCQAWNPESRPAVIDGGWSAWAGTSRSPCSTCKIEGGISIRNDRRYCDDPAPNNGGERCGGSSFRGLVCSLSSDNCGTKSRKSFGDSLCESFKNDPSQPDRQLSGISYLHPSSNCKVWCHLLGSDLIRNKAKFPDGTPCGGRNHYCVNGQCMRLRCNNEAVAGSASDCPLHISRPTRTNQQWSLWSDWSGCSASCGNGVRSRVRVCSSPVSGSCVGPRTEEMRCSGVECVYPPGTSPWSSWSLWTSCSATCGNAVKIRSRTCPGGVGCSGSGIEQKSCPVPPCRAPTTLAPARWSIWGEWGKCSKSCGGGQSRRDRNCSRQGGCFGAGSQIRSCNTENCPSWSQWSDWSLCSLSCGKGKQSRRRVCHDGPGCSGIHNQESFCNFQACPVSTWSGWSGWSVCSSSCGEGVQSRSRQCENGPGCNGPHSSLKSCFSSQSCVSWSEWSEYSECSVSCGEGSRWRARSCPTPGSCSGSSRQTIPCNTRLCQSWGNWGEWSVCSQSCGGGITVRRRQCPPGHSCHGVEKEINSCSQEACPSWSVWGDWEGCSKTCGSGSQRRRRSCSGTTQTFLITDGGTRIINRDLNKNKIKEPCEGDAFQSRGCSISGCAVSGGGSLEGEGSAGWGEWSSWSSCSSSCGLGFQERKRDCRRFGSCSGIRIQRLVCREERCGREERGEWGLWGTCSKTCGQGLRTRSRSCSSSQCSENRSGSEETQICNTSQCLIEKQWQEWGRWGECSRSCGGGRQERGRNCEGGATGDCRGFTKEERPCNPHSCPSPRQAVLKLGVIHKQTTKIDERLPSWSGWSEWSGCSCFSGKRVRRRFCRVFNPQILGFCLGRVLEEETCSSPQQCSPVAGGWTGWSEWSSCSVDCGEGGRRIRYRICADPYPINRGVPCVGKSFEKSFCISQPSCQGPRISGGWSEWYAWSPCSAQCGKGHTSRTRHCNQPRPENGGKNCLGPDFDLQDCESYENCQSALVDGNWSRWGDWTGCNQACGFTFRKRQRTCTDPPPSLGGKACRGLGHMTKLCTLPPCPNALAGGWSQWNHWSSCQLNCGYGTQTRERRCDAPVPRAGGMPCLGSSNGVRSCTIPEERCLMTLENSERLEETLRHWEMYSD